MFRAMANNYTVRLGFLQTRPEINVVDYDYGLQSPSHSFPNIIIHLFPCSETFVKLGFGI